MKIDELTFDVLKVFMLPNINKIDYFGKWEEDRVFVFPDLATVDGIQQPAECFALMAFKTFKEYRGVFHSDPAWESIKNVWCVVDMAFTCGYTVGYFWNIGPEKNISGPIDDVWSVLATLSSNALALRGIPFETPRTTFAEFLTYWDVREVRISRSDGR